MSNNENALKLVGPITSLILASAAIWYAVETRALRLQDYEHIKILQHQMKLKLAPFLSVGVTTVKPKDVEMIREKIKLDEGLEEEKRKALLERLKTTPISFICQVTNASSKIACHVDLYIFDKKHASFSESISAKDYIAEKEKEIFLILPRYMTYQKICKTITDRYGTESSFLFSHLKPSDNSYVMVVYEDIENRVYAVRRPFVITEDGDISHKRSELLFSRR